MNADDPAQVIETYRYDALGRRVLVHALHDSTCTSNGCESTVERFVWAGNQLIAETRGKAKDATPDATVEYDLQGGNGEFGAPEAYGRVIYTQAGGIDRPLGLIRINSVNTVYAAVYPRPTGAGSTRRPPRKAVPCIPAPTSFRSLGCGHPPTWGRNSQGTPCSTGLAVWSGSSRFASGLLYRRNRYYDPAQWQVYAAGSGGDWWGAECVRVWGWGSVQQHRSVWVMH